MRNASFKISVVALLLAVSGCAGAPGGGECHGVQWYRLGLDDGMKDAKGELERYAASCGADFGRAQYEQGFRDGLARRPKPPAQQ
jgi:hypothetical protein